MKQKSNKGFTLIELLVVIVIIGLLSTLVMANFREGEKRRRVQLASDGIISAIREMQNDSLSGFQLSASGCAQGKAGASYKVVVTLASSIYNGIGTDKCGSTFTLVTNTLPTGTRLRPVSGINKDGTNQAAAVLLFTPPFGKITEQGTSFTNVTFTVESIDGTIARTITVNGISGRIQ